MTIEFTMNYRMPDGVIRKTGELLDLPDDDARAIIAAGAAREWRAKSGLKEQ